MGPLEVQVNGRPTGEYSCPRCDEMFVGKIKCSTHMVDCRPVVKATYFLERNARIYVYIASFCIWFALFLILVK
jgi:hypothetical protein